MQFIPPVVSVVGMSVHFLVTCAVTSLHVLQKPRVSDRSNVQFPVGQSMFRVDLAFPRPRRLL